MAKSDPPAAGCRRIVGIATVSFGSDEVLPALLDSIPQACSRPVEITVVDNSPSPAIEAIALAAGANYLPLSTNAGYGFGMNTAVAQFSSEVEWVLLTNPDVVLHPNALDQMVNTLSMDCSIAAVGPRIMTQDGDIYPSARAVPSFRTGVGHALLGDIWVDNPWSRAYRNERHLSTTSRDAGWLSGACLLVRRSAFASVSGFDTRYFMYFEDVDLGYRLSQAGFRNVYDPTAVVTHVGAHSTRSRQTDMLAAHHVSARLFISVRYPGAGRWPLRFALGAGLRIRSRVLRRPTR